MRRLGTKMDKLIITITADSSMSYPRNQHMPPIEDVDAVAQEYIRSVDAGASLVHHHGVHYLEPEIQADGRRVSKIDFDGWRNLTEKIRAARNPIMQFGIASARLEDKIALMALKPEMMSYAFNAHDEYFRPDARNPDCANDPANEIYAQHPRAELAKFCAAAKEHNVKPEVEFFHSGGIWNMEFIRAQGLLDDPVWAICLFGWEGGAWTPATPEALLFIVKHLPERVNWHASVLSTDMGWRILSMAMAIGGHVRVGFEDNPYLPDGTPAKSNAELVDVVVSMARNIGREVATPEEARAIVGLAPGGR